MESRRKLGITYLYSFLGRWYRWGGDDPSGFDCSGLMIEVLSAVGRFPAGSDTTAAGLSQRYPACAPKPGALIFRGNPAVHVEMVVAVIGDDVITIGASGGGSKTKTVEDAVAQNAFIKMRPWKGDYSFCVDPFDPNEE
jgi:cell wall-associated NlpC family hydrolase